MLNEFLAKAQSAVVPEFKTIDVGSLQSLKDQISKVVNTISAALFLLAVVLVVSAAYDYLTAGLDEKKVDSAKSKITYAAIGIAMLAVAQSIPRLIVNLLTS